MEAASSAATDATATDTARWVVGVDGSECSRHAALWAACHAPDRADELQLATAWSVPAAALTPPMGALAMGDLTGAIADAARATVVDLADKIGPSSCVPVTTSVGHGGAASVLLQAARHSALLVVGSRGHGGFARLALGSTSTQCATHAPIPVAVVPATAPILPVSSMMVAFDGSPNSIAALEWAVGFAAPDSVVHCVSVWDTPPIAVGGEQFFFPEASGLAEERFEHLVAHTLESIGRNDVGVRTRFVLGQPGATLAELAADSDLLVVGARGHGGIGAAILGSVSTWLLHHADRPTVVVPDPSHRGQVRT